MQLNFPLIGRRVKEIRLQRNISQAQLAEGINMSVCYISHIETGKSQASLEVLMRISDMLSLTLNELLSGNQYHDPAEYQTELIY